MLSRHARRWTGGYAPGRGEPAPRGRSAPTRYGTAEAQVGSTFAGADGCRGGAWAVSLLGPDGYGQLRVVTSFAAALEAMAGAALALVDIPVGFAGGVGTRACDREARRWLRGRRGGPSSVFPPPARGVVEAAGKTGLGWEEAVARNLALTGRRISKQCYNILARMAEVDAAFRATPGLQGRCRESHPEVCFAALNGWRPMGYRKRSAEGRAERADLLERRVPGAAATLTLALESHRRSVLGADDVLDAMVLALAAREAARRGCPTLPPSPEVDGRGLRMEMVCPEAAPP